MLNIPGYIKTWIYDYHTQGYNYLSMPKSRIAVEDIPYNSGNMDIREQSHLHPVQSIREVFGLSVSSNNNLDFFSITLHNAMWHCPVVKTICLTDRKEILYTSGQLHCCDVAQISLWSVAYILNQSTASFGRISNSIVISLVWRVHVFHMWRKSLKQVKISVINLNLHLDST